jgi:ankyrin repeat protein
VTDPDGATALVIAIINANYDFAALLIEAGADPNIVDKDAAMGPLYAAIDMHRLAVGHGRPNPRPAGLPDSVDIVRRLLDCKADPNAALKASIFQRQHTGGDASLGKGATRRPRTTSWRMLLDGSAIASSSPRTATSRICRPLKMRSAATWTTRCS